MVVGSVIYCGIVLVLSWKSVIKEKAVSAAFRVQSSCYLRSAVTVFNFEVDKQEPSAF